MINQYLIFSLKMQVNTILEIDLDIIKENYLKLKKLCSCDVGAAVKANSYGLGATQITKLLIELDCKHFFVATLDEGLELRRHYPQIPIYVLSGLLDGQQEYFVHYNLIPVINSLYQLSLLNEYLKEKNMVFDAVIHIETGMNRLAVPEYEILVLTQNKNLYSNVNFIHVMSHLANSEIQDHEFNKIQLEKFKRLKSYFGDIKASFANTGGILLGKEYHFDVTRPGAGLYGLNVVESMSIFSNPVRLFSPLIQVKKVQKGETLGYNQTYTFDKESIVGTIGVGYADRIFRTLSNKGYCYINGHKVRIIGRISMDLIDLDLTNLPEELKRVGQEVGIICNEQTPDQLGKLAGTFGYEIITSLGDRYVRKYKSKKLQLVTGDYPNVNNNALVTDLIPNLDERLSRKYRTSNE